MQRKKQTQDFELVNDIASFTHDPYGFVLYAFPWGKNELADRWPNEWQIETLEQIGRKLQSNEADQYEAIRIAIASGHGIGKSALVSWVILWAMSTHEDTRGVVTANTENQLKTKTWAEVAKWYRLLICKHWFKHTATALFSADPEHERTWRLDMSPWSERNTEAFAGLHNRNKRILLIYDEASAIPDIIWEVSEGALTDEETEIIWLACGNPTRNSGRFRECFGRFKHRWHTRQIDSRTVPTTNKAQLNQWVEDYGEDSDFVRVRVRGMFPSASDMQLIPSGWVYEAMRREELYTIDDPIIMGIDIARGGSDNNVIVTRRGHDVRSIPALVIPGSETRDSMKLVTRIVSHVHDNKPDAVFVDSTSVGGPIADRLRQLGVNAIDVNFASKAIDENSFANLRAEMWWKMREAIKTSLALPNDSQLEQELTTVEYGHDNKNRVLLERKDDMKKRGLASPDHGDAIAITYAYPVIRAVATAISTSYIKDYDPYHDL